MAGEWVRRASLRVKWMVLPEEERDAEQADIASIRHRERNDRNLSLVTIPTGSYDFSHFTEE